MKTYRVLASSIQYYAINIEAENEQEAIDKAWGIDGGIFAPLEASDWQIDEACIASPLHLEHYPTIKTEEV